MPSEFHVYTSSSSPLLGEVVIIIGASPKDEFSYRGESFVLAERSPATLYHAKISFNSASLPEDMIADPFRFVLDAALRAGKADVARLLKTRFDMTNDWNIFARPIEYEPADRSHLATLWIMGRWNEELKHIYSASECEELVDWLRIVKQCQAITESHVTVKL